MLVYLIGGMIFGFIIVVVVFIVYSWAYNSIIDNYIDDEYDKWEQPNVTYFSLYRYYRDYSVTDSASIRS